MKRTRRILRRAFAAHLSALMVALTVAVPVMGRADFDHHERWESQHERGGCAHGHDHTVCTSFRTNHLTLPAGAVAYQLDLVVMPVALETGLSSAILGGIREGHPTRAPPSV